SFRSERRSISWVSSRRIRLRVDMSFLLSFSSDVPGSATTLKPQPSARLASFESFGHFAASEALLACSLRPETDEITELKFFGLRRLGTSAVGGAAQLAVDDRLHLLEGHRAENPLAIDEIGGRSVRADPPPQRGVVGDPLGEASLLERAPELVEI